jgi:hypothetical protein
MEKAFERLRFELNRSADLMGDFLPHDTLMRVGESLTFSAMKEALGEDVSPKDTGIVIGSMIQSNNQITIASLEDHYIRHRQVQGLKNGHLLLKHLIECVHDPLKNWVVIDKLNAGGRPPKIARRYLIHRLAEMALEIIGKPAAVAKVGPFVRLCSQVLPACGLPAKGVAGAVPSIVEEMQAGKQFEARLHELSQNQSA